VTDGKVQVDVSSLDWKLDRLLSMYTEVNSVEFDTAAFDGSTGSISITNAAGGAVSDLMFWGEPYSFGYNERLFYSLDNQRYFIDSADGSYIPLYGLVLGTSIPESVTSSYTLSSGVWQRSDGQYIISDTYEARTGRLIRRTQFDTDGNLVVAASPQEVLCPSHTMILPSGNSNFFEGFGLRITFNYDQLGSVTKTADIITAINNIPTYDDTNLISAVTTISDQITEQFGEYDSTYSFPNFSSSGQSSSSNKAVSGVLPSAFTSINPGSKMLLYSPSGTLTLLKSRLYTGSGTCTYVTGSPYFDSTYGVGYCLQFEFRFSSSQSTRRYETVQFPQVSFTDYSGKSLSLSAHTDSVLVQSYSRYAFAYRYYFPRWDASGSWLGWSGQNDTFQWTSSSYAPSKRVYLTPPESGTYYIYGTSDTAIPVVYASRFTGFLQSQTDRVVNAVGSIPAPTDYTAQLTAVTGRMDDILAQLQSTSGSATCEHTYSQHMEQEATCILPGLMISTCSKCGDSSSEIVDPLGHDWQCTSHVDAVTDPDTGEETSSAYDIYTCSRCGDTYEDHTGTGAPDEDYSNTTISQLVVKVFSKLGTFAGKLLGSVVHLFDKAVTAVDDLASKFNDYVEQIKGFGENYPIWLSGFWGIIPAELQVALTFAVICMALGVVGKKLFFS